MFIILLSHWAVITCRRVNCLSMTNFNYTSIPACATELDGGSGASKRPTISIATPSWVQPQAEQSGSPVGNGPASPAKQSFTNALISSALQLPNLPETPAGGDARLLSNRESLSIPTTTVNFRRFVAKSGPVFWLQDRIEEIVMWRKGWKVTCAWMAIYSFLCSYCLFSKDPCFSNDASRRLFPKDVFIVTSFYPHQHSSGYS